MIKILILFALGAGLGFTLRKNKKTMKTVDKLVTYSVYLLLFTLGISVGISKEIVANIGKYAYQSVILALGGITGSIIIAYFIYLQWFRSDKDET